MKLAEILGSDRLILGLRARDKAQLLQDLAARAAAATAIPYNEIHSALLEREQLGSTGLGQGFALPHARLSGCEQIYSLLARLNRPIEFDAIDGQPVDLIVLMLLPNNNNADNMAALAAVSRTMRDSSIRTRIRKAATAAEVVEALRP